MKASFIELITRQNKSVLVNVQAITRIDSDNAGAIVYFAGDVTPVYANMSYQHVCELIECVANGGREPHQLCRG